MIENLDHRIKVILALCQKANETSVRWESEERKLTHRAFWDAVMALDREAGDGVQAGRFLQIPFGTGYARYIVSRVGKKTCKVIHLDYMDGKRSPVVDKNSEIWTGEVEGRLLFEDTVKAAFARQHPRVVAAEPVAA